MTQTASTDGISAAEAPLDAETVILPPEALAANLIQKLKDNPMLIEPSLALLRACAAEAVEEAALVACVHGELEATGALPVQPLSAVLRMLAADGALVESVQVDGAPYAGTLQDAFEDEALSEEAEVLIWARATEAGRIVAADLAPERRADALFAERPDFEEAFLVTLDVCDREGGVRTAQLQDELDGRGLLRRDERTNIPELYPSLFTNLLKDAGCIRWEHGWITTDLGRAVARARAV